MRRSATSAIPPPAPASCAMPSRCCATFHLGPVAVAHNGNLINAALLRQRVRSARAYLPEHDRHGDHRPPAGQAQRTWTRHDPLPHVLKHLQGAFSLLFLFPDRIEACRDPWGIRPLVLGKTPEGHWCVASETCAFDAIGAEFVREVEPGELVRIDDTGLTTRRFDVPAAEKAHVRVRARLLRQPGEPDLRAERPPGPRGDGPAARPRGAGGGRLRDADARLRPQRRAGFRQGIED